MMMSINNFKLFYALILLLLLLSQIVAGSSESGEVKCIERERLALLSFKQGLIDYWGLLSTWMDDEINNGDCCKWKGIECSNETGHVFKLHLRGSYTRYLRGSINISSLIDLQSIEYLDLSYNAFPGNNIPELLGSFTNLRYLNLSHCQLGGRIPPQLGNLKHLQYLDLRYNELRGVIPPQIGNLSMLQTLGLGSYSDYIEIRDAKWLSNLSTLTNLELSSLVGNSHDHLLEMIGKLLPHLRELRLIDFSLSDNDMRSLFNSQHFNISTSLTILDLSDNELTSSAFQLLSNLSFNLQQLYLSSNNIVLLPPIHSYFPSLVILDLSGNILTSSSSSSSIFQSHFNFSSKLQELHLRNCSLTDISFLALSSASYNNSSSSNLVILDLSDNQLKSSAVFHWLFNFKKLQELHLSNNKLKGDISSIFQNSSWCNRHILQTLDLSYNMITGMLPNLSTFYSLRRLDLSHNQLFGDIPKSIGLLHELETLYLEGNHLKGEVSELHLTSLSKLVDLDLSENSLSLKFSIHWVPAFQLRILGLASCRMGPSFPNWLRYQRRLIFLDISASGINDSVPLWFWNKLQSISMLNMSNNNLRGTIPNLPRKVAYASIVILNSNQLEGEVPAFLSQASTLDLSKNNISGLSTFLCGKRTANIRTLDLSNNQIKGQLPDCWEHLKSLEFLDVSHNQLTGKIPPSMNNHVELQALVLRNNSLIGELPYTLSKFSNLVILDVSENLLSGPIPSWIGESLQQLKILSLRENRFFGSLPSHLCYLSRIHVLDISRNNLSKGIPTCLNNFTTMMNTSIDTSKIVRKGKMSSQLPYVNIYESTVLLMWKGQKYIIKNPEVLLRTIDFSNNHLTGEIPNEIGQLLGLNSLNLSRNNLSGEIPSNIGNLNSLEFLDLSRNHLTGRIPTTLSQIDSLGLLDLSNNNLSGKVPFGRHFQTFEASSFEGNRDLCGDQLHKTCPEDKTPEKPRVLATTAPDEDDNSDFYNALYMSLGLGFLTGLWGFIGSLLFWKTWRKAYSKFLNKLTLNITKRRG